MDRETSSLLLRRAREGSREALDTLFAECGERLLALIRLRLGPSLRPHVDSADILQETLLRGFEHLDEFEGSNRITLVAWLATIACNQIRNQAEFLHRRRRDVARTVPLDGQPEIAAELRSEISRLRFGEETARLEQALESLARDHREVILARDYEELGFREIGARLGKSEDASRMLYARALVALTKRVRELSERSG